MEVRLLSNLLIDKKVIIWIDNDPCECGCVRFELNRSKKTLMCLLCKKYVNPGD